jgi:hypothetical protein
MSNNWFVDKMSEEVSFEEIQEKADRGDLMEFIRLF